MKPERRWGFRDELLDMGRVKPDAARLAVDGRASRGQEIDRPVAEELDADLGQDPERCAVEDLDLVGGEDLDRAVGVPDGPPRQLGDPARRPTRSTPAGLGHHGRTIRRAAGRR